MSLRIQSKPLNRLMPINTVVTDPKGAKNQGEVSSNFNLTMSCFVKMRATTIEPISRTNDSRRKKNSFIRSLSKVKNKKLTLAWQ